MLERTCKGRKEIAIALDSTQLRFNQRKEFASRHINLASSSNFQNGGTEGHAGPLLTHMVEVVADGAGVSTGLIS